MRARLEVASSGISSPNVHPMTLNKNGILPGPNILALAAIFFLLLFGPGETWAITEQKKVLILHSDNPFLPANMIMDQKFLNVLRESKKIHVAIYSEYLELARFSSANYYQRLLDLMKERYSGMKLDLIIATDDISWDFLQGDGRKIFQKSPQVFCGLSAIDPTIQHRNPLATGNFKDSAAAIHDTIHIVPRIHPDLSNLFIIVGNGSQDAVWEKMALDAVEKLHPGAKFNITFLKHHSVKELAEMASKMGEKTAIVFVSIFKDGRGVTFNPRDALFLVSRNAKAPIYGVSDTYLGHGIVGGSLVSYGDFSTGAAMIALRILEGENPKDIAAVPYANKYYFDWKEIKKYGINASLLPPGSVVLNKPPDIWESYRWQIVGTGVFIIVESFLLFLLLLSRMKRKKMQADLEKSEMRYREFVEGTTDLITQIDGNGRLLYVNHSANEIFGEPPGDCIGRSAYDFVHPDDRASTEAAFSQWIGQKLTSLSHENRNINKHGLTRTMLWTINIHYTDGNVTEINSIARDITEIRNAESKLKTALKEKEVLLQEVYHRTKNNMQIISALLDLQAAGISDERLKIVLADIVRRIYAMSLIHQKLYESKDLSRIDLKHYILDLSAEINRGLIGNNCSVAIETDLEDGILLLIDAAIPCGLVINELLVNSIKHGFPGNMTGAIRIELKRSDAGFIKIAVIDNGIGMPDGFDFRKNCKMGMQLIISIIEDQLQGTVELVSGKGTKFVVTFHENIYKNRV